MLTSVFANAQNEADTLAKDNLSIPLPTVSINVGLNYAFSDVALGGVSPARQLGYQLNINQQVTKFLNASFEFYTGSLYGEEQRGLTNINYRTSLVSPRIGIEYNFYPLLKPDSRGRQLIRPYVGFGVGMIFFRSKGDLKDANGRTYNYWSDGLIYAEEEETVNPSEATLLERDNEYETDLRDANLDNFGKYSQTAFTLPINAGIRFQLSKNVGVNAAFAYVLNFTDLIDNSSSESIGARQGNSGFDNHLFGSVGLSVFLGRTKPSAKPTKPRFEEQLVSEEQIKTAEKEKVEKKDEVKKWNELESISDQLIDASTSMREISTESEKSIAANSESLSSISKRTIETQKDLNNAKKESIEVLESSITVLAKTTTDLSKASNKIEAVVGDLSSKNIENQFSGAEKIKATVEETIPAMELLKIRIAKAKTEEELRSILNISARNLTHTQNIFSEESSEINKSIVRVRKTVAEARTTEVLSGNASSLSEINSVREELNELLSQGVLSQKKYVELSDILNSKEVEVSANEVAKGAESELQNTSQLLKNALSYLQETGNVTGENLSHRRNELNSIASQSLSTKKALDAAKAEALQILDKALNDLEEANKTVDVAQSDLSKVGDNLTEFEQKEFSDGTNAINSSIEKTISLIVESKSIIGSSKNSSELKSAINYASAKLIETKETVSAQSEKLATEIDKARKDFIVSEVELANKNAIPKSEGRSDKIPPEGSEKLNSQLDKLLADGLIDADEYRMMQGAVSLATENETISPTTTQPNQGNSTSNSGNEDKSTEKAESDRSGSFDIASIEESQPKETGAFSWADLNKNNWISPDEVLHFIDELFEGDGLRTVEDIQELIDYYFDQE
jgi:opacity protein-like surface antigen